MSAGRLQRDALRLELVRLVHRFDHSPEQVIERAKELEAYVLGTKAQADKPEEGPAAKP